MKKQISMRSVCGVDFALHLLCLVFCKTNYFYKTARKKTHCFLFIFLSRKETHDLEVGGAQAAPGNATATATATPQRAMRRCSRNMALSGRFTCPMSEVSSFNLKDKNH